MKIGIVHNGIVPPGKYGGTERVIWSLAKGLRAKGHEVTLIVSRNSPIQEKFIPIEEILDFRSEIEKMDVLHIHSGVKEVDYFSLPRLFTFHGNMDMASFLDENTVFVSKNHAERYGSNVFVHNGLDWSDYQQPQLQENRSYFHFLGKAAWRVKNLKGAISIVNSIPKEKLYVMGGVRFNISMGMRFTFSPKIKFLGMVDDEKKSEVLQKSKGLIFPVLWNEPFGLAITESLFFGCPVFGTPYGALPELVNEEVGFLSNSKEELREAVMISENYSKKVCHQYAKENFNHILMSERYLNLYEKVLSDEKLNNTKPTLLCEEPKFLNWNK